MNKPSPNEIKPAAPKNHHIGANESQCPFCEESHPANRCEVFTSKDFRGKQELARETSVCYNSLRTGHSVKKCLSSHCRKCGRYHNTLLHYESIQVENKPREANSCLGHPSDPASVLLATFLVRVADSNGVAHEMGALLNNGSQTSFISTGCVRRVGMKAESSNISITGIGQARVATENERVSLKITSRYSPKTHIKIDAILNKVTGELPSLALNKN
ncbi:unnamed protein product [Allacma fusca]|uniref:Uncharacterized protein n=1 Tax=Allacma fusca TaxID=39272 RepID=A0A8J2LCS3_9HEXA|nr:unnamed protein product [Allacma fusca]